jgi:hypothetical protein
MRYWDGHPGGIRVDAASVWNGRDSLDVLLSREQRQQAESTQRHGGSSLSDGALEGKPTKAKRLYSPRACLQCGGKRTEWDIRQRYFHCSTCRGACPPEREPEPCDRLCACGCGVHLEDGAPKLRLYRVPCKQRLDRERNRLWRLAQKMGTVREIVRETSACSAGT